MLKGIGSKSDAVNLMPELKQKLNYEFKVTVIVQTALKTWLRMECKLVILVIEFLKMLYFIKIIHKNVEIFFFYSLPILSKFKICIQLSHTETEHL